LHDETPGSTFWFNRGVNWNAVTAQLLGTTVALLSVNSTLVVGPIANTLGGADLSALLGPVVAAGVYAGLTLWRRGTV
jgi:NCS1 family nucleobase:cation symporter-1